MKRLHLFARLGNRARGAAVLAVLVLAATAPAASASFADTQHVATTTIDTDSLTGPANLALTQTCTPPTTIVLRAVSTGRGSGSLALPTPSGTVAGDVLVAQIANRYGAFPLSAPGWNLIDRQTSGSAVTSALFWRVAVAAEPASTTFTLSGSSAQMAGGIAAYSGVKASDPVNVSAVGAGNGDTATAPSVTTTKVGTMLVHAVDKRQEDLAAPTGSTQRWRLMSGNGTANLGVSAGDRLFTGPGATGTTTSVSSSSFDSEWVAHTVALRPIPGTPTAAATWTATSTPWATGYRLDRSVGGTVQNTRTVTPPSTTSTSDGPLVNDTTYDYRLYAYYRSWTSPAAVATFTPSC
jgi:hypothetical protein